MTKLIVNGRELLQQYVTDRGKDFFIGEDYVNSTTKLTVRCNKCQYTWMSSPSNIKRNGCISCNKRIKNSIEKIQATLKETGRDIEVLTQTYKNSSSRLDLFCNVCTHTWTTAASVLINQGCGCPACNKGIKLSTEVLQTRLTEKNLEITILSNYTHSGQLLSCRCDKCLIVWESTLPKLVYFDQGCPSCNFGNQASGYNPSKAGYLYYLRVVDKGQTFWKVGITNVGVKSRFKKLDREKISVLYCQLFANGADAQKAERNILNMFKEYRAENLKILSSGNTELFTHDVLQMNHLNWGPI